MHTWLGTLELSACQIKAHGPGVVVQHLHSPVSVWVCSSDSHQPIWGHLAYMCRILTSNKITAIPSSLF